MKNKTRSFLEFYSDRNRSLATSRLGVCRKVCSTTVGAAALALGLLANGAYAGTEYTWVPNAVFTWNDAASWTAGLEFPNAAGDTANLIGSALVPVVTLGQDITLGNLVFKPTKGVALTINAGKILTFDSGDPDSNATFVFGNTTGKRGFQLNINSALSLTSNLDVTIFTERSATFGGNLSGAGALNININTANSQENARRLVFSKTNDNSGGTSINGVNTTDLGQVHVRLDSDNAVGSGLLTLAGNYDFNLNGHNQSVAGLQGSSSGTAHGSWFPNGVRNGLVATTRTLQLNLTDGQQSSYSGVIHGKVARNDSPTTLSGDLSLIVDKAAASSGTGIQTLTGVNTYTGPTTVNGGTLALSGSGSLASAVLDIRSGAFLDVSELAAWTLGAGQTLTGTGTVTGNVTTNGSVAPGAPGGTLTVDGNFTFASDSSLNLEINPLGNPQIETATTLGDALYDGIMVVTVTGEGIVGAPLVVNVPVLQGDTADQCAAKVRDALSATGAVTALYTVSGSGPDIVLTRITPGIYDATLNIELGVDLGDDPMTGLADISADTSEGGPPSFDNFVVSGALDVSGVTLNPVITGNLPAAPLVIVTYGTGQLTGTFANIDPPLPTGYVLDYAASGGTAIAITQGVASTYADWLANYPPAAGFNTDSDSDGIPNGVEHILGTNPNTRSVGLTQIAATANSVTFQHTLNGAIASDVTRGYQWSTDLTEWRASGQTNSGGSTASIAASTPVSGVVTVTITITNGPAAKLFGRLTATKVP